MNRHDNEGYSLMWLPMAHSLATRVVLSDPVRPDAGAGCLHALTMPGVIFTARPVVWQLACEHLSRLAARLRAVVFSLTACPVQEKAELQAAAEAAQHQLETAAEAAAGEREAACSGLLAELQVKLKGRSSPVHSASCMATCHTPPLSVDFNAVCSSTALCFANITTLSSDASPLQAAYQQLEEVQACAAHPVTLNLTVAAPGVSATDATAVSAELTPSPAHQALESAVVAAAEALLALGCDMQQLEGAGCSPLPEVGSALQTCGFSWLQCF